MRVEATAGRVERIERPDATTLRVTFRGLETTREHVLSAGALATLESATCDGADVALAAGPFGTSTALCGGAGRHVLVVRARPR